MASMRIKADGVEIIFTEGITESIEEAFSNKHYDSSENGLLLQKTFIGLAKRMQNEPHLMTKRFTENVFFDYQGSTADPRASDFILNCDMTKVTDNIFVIYQGRFARFQRVMTTIFDKGDTA